MSPRFDWRSEEEKEWDEFVHVAKPANESQQIKHRRMIFLVALLVAISIGLLGFRQLRRLVTDRTTSTEESVRSSHGLVQLAAVQSDPEILASLLPNTEPHWTATQLTLIDRELMFDRQPLGMEWQADKPPIAESIEISSDLGKATVETTYEYLIPIGNGNKQSIAMKQTAYYRRHKTAWNLSRPPDEFWGDTFSSRGRYLTLIYPERDAEIGERLAVDLEGVLAAACSAPFELNCDDNSHLRLEFATDPAVMIDLSDPEKDISRGRELSLATPTLVGLPTDEAGYRALLRGYADRAMVALVGAQVEWACCRHVLFFQAFIDFLLQRLGIGLWPLNASEYLQALDHPASLEQLEQLWNVNIPSSSITDRPDWWMAYALVEFLMLESSGASAPLAIGELSTADAFSEWLTKVAVSTPNLEPDFERFVQGKIIAVQDSPPVAWPDQDIILMCGDGTKKGANLYRYDLSAEAWSLDESDREFVSLIGIPDGKGVLLTEQMMNPDTLSTFLLRSGREMSVASGGLAFDLAGNIDPSGRYLPLIGSDSEEFSGTPYILDLTSCQPNGCDLHPVSGLPVWSPDGSKVLLSSVALQNLSLADDVDHPSMPLGSGREPFWLDEDTFGFLRGREQPEVVVGSDSYQLKDVLFTSADLASIAQVTDQDLEITHIIVQPVEPRLLFATATNRQANEGYLYLYDWAADSLALVADPTELQNGPTPIDFSPDGRWLALLLEGKPAMQASQSRDILLYDTIHEQSKILEVDAARLFPISDWSADGQWLLQLGSSKLILTAPNEMYKHLIVHSFNDCTSAIWID